MGSPPDSAVEEFPRPYGKYELLGRLGDGGMAEVFLARQSGIAGFRKTLVIKRILPHLARKKRFVEMFVAEASLAAEVRHRNVVQVYELGRVDEELFMAMEYVEGTDLRVLLGKAAKQKLRIPPWFSLHVVCEVLEALAFAWSLEDESGRPRHIVHRDVTPSNIFVSNTGEVKLGDFGVARDHTRESRTRAGQLKGKLAYMAPEQLYSKPPDHRVDVFAVGVVLWEALAQRRLFGGRPDIEVMQAISQGPRRSPLEFVSDVPAELDPILQQALAIDREVRTQSAEAMQDQLLEVLHRLRPRVRTGDVQAVVGELLERTQAGALRPLKEVRTRPGTATLPAAAPVAAPPPPASSSSSASSFATPQSGSSRTPAVPIQGAAVVQDLTLGVGPGAKKIKVLRGKADPSPDARPPSRAWSTQRRPAPPAPAGPTGPGSTGSSTLGEPSEGGGSGDPLPLGDAESSHLGIPAPRSISSGDEVDTGSIDDPGHPLSLDFDEEDVEAARASAHVGPRTAEGSAPPLAPAYAEAVGRDVDIDALVHDAVASVQAQSPRTSSVPKESMMAGLEHRRILDNSRQLRSERWSFIVDQAIYDGPHPFWIRDHEGTEFGPVSLEQALQVVKVEVQAGLGEDAYIASRRGEWTTMRAFLDMSGMETLTLDLPDLDADEGSAWSGTAAGHTLGEVMVSLSRSSASGRLIVETKDANSSDRCRVIEMVRGRPTYVSAGSEALQIPQLLVSKRLIHERTLAPVLHGVLARQAPLGRVLADVAGVDIGRYFPTLMKERMAALFTDGFTKFSFEADWTPRVTEPFAPSLLAPYAELSFRFTPRERIERRIEAALHHALEPAADFEALLPAFAFKPDQLKIAQKLSRGRRLAKLLDGAPPQQARSLRCIAYVLLETELLRPA